MIAMEKGWFDKPGLTKWEAVTKSDFRQFVYFVSLHLISNAKT